MKIAMICGYPLRGAYTGMPYLKGLAQHLSQIYDVDLHIITFGDTNKDFRENKITFHVIKRILPSSLMFAIEPSQLRRIILKINPDIVHAQGGNPPNIAAMLVRHKYPTILTVHGVWAEMVKYERGITRIFLKLVVVPLERLAVSRIPNIIAVSKYQKDLISKITDSMIYVIPPGIDLKNLDNLISVKPVKHPSLFFIGGLMGERKGAHILLQAIKIVKKQIPDIYVYFAGSGSQDTKLKELVKCLDIEDNVAFLGRISDDEKWVYYRSTDIFVIPSLWEGMPTVLFEAMMCGKPVVASEIDGIPEVLEDQITGLLCEAGNFVDLSEKLILLLKNPELRKTMGNAGEKKVKEFTFDKIAYQTASLYRQILSTNPNNG